MTKKYKYKDKDNDNDKDILRTPPKSNPRDLWPLRHWLQFWQLRTWIHDNLSELTIIVTLDSIRNSCDVLFRRISFKNCSDLQWRFFMKILHKYVDGNWQKNLKWSQSGVDCCSHWKCFANLLIMGEDQLIWISFQILTWVWSGMISSTWSYPNGLLLIYCFSF